MKLEYKNTFRNLKIFSVALTLMAIASCDSNNPESKKTENSELISYVDPFIGTDFHGHTYPGPVMPHGMIQVGPDTKLNGWDASSGYHYADSTIYGFSHTHLSGTGIGDMGDFSLLPFTGDIDKKPIAIFDKKNENSKVGYYSVKFSNYDVKAELTTTTRVALHRYKFGKDANKRLLVDIGHILQATWGNSNLYNELEIIDNKTIRGLKHTRGWAKDHKVYFYAEFSSPFTVNKTIVNRKVAEELKIYKGKNVYSYFSFNELADDEKLQIKVSISSVDNAGAKKNIKAELTDWDFERVQKDVEKAWNKELSKIIVSTINKEDLTVFYTALYHSMISPMIYQDVDGRYRGMDKEIHTSKEGTTNYTVYSLWDTYRALHPLMTIIDEEISADWVNNLMLKYKEGGFLPKWPLASNYTGTMVGYPAVANIADALTKKIPGIDIDLALESSIAIASYTPEMIQDNWNDGKKSLMPLYNKFVNEGTYIPADKIVKSVSYGLEMAYYDWCIAEIAKIKGDDEAVEKFEKRSNFYKFYFDKETGFMRGKNTDGSWTTPFNPRYSSHEKSDYIEGNAWQWTWIVPHDVNGLIDLYSGKENFTQKLDTLFTTSSEILGEDASADITGLIGQYAHGNEPSHHITYFYTYAGEAWKTQKLIDQIQKEFYSDKPDGIIGNEDCGQMSAWYILNSMGFYQMTPGNPEYVISRPIFDRVEIPLENGKTFIIITENNSKENLYVQEFYLNGVKQDKLFFQHSDIKAGSTLKIVMGNKPNKYLNN